MNLQKSGFTLIELLLVILLIGIGVMGILPNLIRKAISPNEIETFFNEQITLAYNEAKETGKPVYIKGFKDSKNIINAKGKRISIPSSNLVIGVSVNGENTTGLEYQIAVYPQAICDDFLIKFEKGKTVHSVPLLMEAVYNEK